MKKRFFAIYALVGALVASPIFTSCVDDNESASVSALRGAKAEQLKSVAALNNAKAQAEITLANAEAALKAAQAAQNQALADKYAAEAKIKELEAQLKQDAYDAELAAALAEAESRKIQAEKWIAYYQAEMQKDALNLEKSLMELEAALIQAKHDLQDKIDEIAKEEVAHVEAKYQELKQLAEVYANRMTLYNNYSVAVNKKSIALAEIKADTVTWKESQATAIATREKAIEIAQMQIAALKQYSGYVEDVEALQTEFKKAEVAKDLANDKVNATAKVVADLYDAANNNETLKALKKAYQEAVEAVQVNDDFYVYDEDGNQIAYDYFNFEDYSPYKSSFDKEEIEMEDHVHTYNEYLYLEVEYADLTGIEAAYQAKLNSYEIAAKKAEIETAETGYKALYAAAKKDVDTKKAAYEAASAADKATAFYAWQTAINTYNQAKSALEQAEEELAIAEDIVAQLKATYAIISDTKSCDALVAAAKAYNDEWTKVYTEIAKAEDANEVALEALAEAEIAYNTLDEALNGSKYTYNDYVGTTSVWEFVQNQGFVGYDWYYAPLYTEYIYDSEGNPVLDPVTGEHIYVERYMSTYNYWWYGQEWLSRVMFDQFEEVVAYDNTGALAIAEMITALESAIATAEEEIEELKNSTEREEEIARMEVELEGMNNMLAAMKLELDATKAKFNALQAELTPASEEEEGTEEAPEEGTEEA